MNDRLYSSALGNSRTANRSGVTLIDMACTTLLIGVMAAVAVPRLSSSINYYRIESASKQIASEIEMVRRYAKATGKNQSVTFDLALNKITMSAMADMDHPASYRSVSLNNLNGTVTLVSASFGGIPTLTFDMHGKPVNGGTIQILSGGTVKYIVVNGTSGRISIP
ncbi:MAG: Tfp pilus assembly protein FimT/FimU [Planctomycetaceae bacterium]